MTYIDTTLTPEAGYSYVNNRQVYDVVAGAMTTHPAWDYVEYVDAISGATTYRRYVWKCKTPENGLTYDFFVMFEVSFTTAGTVWNTAGGKVTVYMGEAYASGTLSRFATNASSVTLAADRSNPATFPLATAIPPTTAYGLNNFFGWTTSNLTSFRCIGLVAKDVLIMNWGWVSSGTAGIGSTVYIGTYESMLGDSVDPVKLMLLTSSGGGATRAPTFAPASVQTEVFALSSTLWSTGTNILGTTNTVWVPPGPFPPIAGTNGTIGATSTNWYLNYGGPVAARISVTPGCAGAAVSTKGLVRGWLKYFYGANLPTHAAGDTFLVNSRVHVGCGYTVGALIDTEAA